MKKYFKFYLIIIHLILFGLFVGTVTIKNKENKKHYEEELFNARNPERKTEQELNFVLDNFYSKSNLHEIFNKINESELSNEDIYLIDDSQIDFSSDGNAETMYITYCYFSNVGNVYGMFGNGLSDEFNEYSLIEEVIDLNLPKSKKFNPTCKLCDFLNAYEELSKIEIFDIDNHKLSDWCRIEVTGAKYDSVTAGEYYYKDGKLSCARENTVGNFAITQLIDSNQNKIRVLISI